MEETIFNRIRLKILTRNMGLWLGIIVLFYAVVCTPVNLYLVSDVLLAGTVLPLLWDFLMIVCNYLFYWVAFSYLLYAWLRFGVRDSVRLTVVYAVAAVIRYIANHLAGTLVNGGQSVNDFFSDFWNFIFFDILSDILLAAILLGLFGWLTKRRFQNHGSEEERLSVLTDGCSVRLFSLKSPVRKLALVAAVIPAAIQLILHIWSYLIIGKLGGVSEVLWMLFYYLSDVLFLLGGYVLINLLLQTLFMAEQKAAAEM